MEIREVKENKKQFHSLLLLADEQEDMIDRYIDKGTMHVLDDGVEKLLKTVGLTFTTQPTVDFPHSTIDVCDLLL